MTVPLFVELCAGTAALSLALHFGGTAEWLTLSRAPAWKPSEQVGMFGQPAVDTGRRKAR